MDDGSNIILTSRLIMDLVNIIPLKSTSYSYKLHTYLQSSTTGLWLDEWF